MKALLEYLIDKYGKGPGMVAVGHTMVICATIVALTSTDALIGLAAVFVPIVGGLYGGGAWKSYQEAKFANGNGKPQGTSSLPR